MRCAHLRPVTCTWIILILLLLPTTSPAQEWVGKKAICTDVKVGRLGLLRNVHAYEQDGVAIAPIRCIAEALGATVDYGAPDVMVRSEEQDVFIRIELGSRLAEINGHEVYMGAEAKCYADLACCPVRFLAEGLGATVDYRDDRTESDYAFSGNPRIVIEADDTVVQSPVIAEVGSDDTEVVREACVILVHEQPPDAVAKFVHDMRNQTQHGVALDESHDLGKYGIDWILRVTELASDGRHFLSSTPECWLEDSPLAPVPEYEDDGVARDYIVGQGYVPPLPERPEQSHPGFFSNAAAVYGLRNGQWRLLEAMQDYLTRQNCERLAIPYDIARELHIVSPPETTRSSQGTEDEACSRDWRSTPQNEPVVFQLTPGEAEHARHIGHDYYVSGLNFRRGSAYEQSVVKVLGQIETPSLDLPTQEADFRLTLTAFDNANRVIGFSSILLESVGTKGQITPFQATLRNIDPAELGYVSILPKGYSYFPEDQ